MPPKSKPASRPASRATPAPKRTRKNAKVVDPKAGECTICFESYNNDYGELKCNHVYCYQCISNWSQKENTCPLCKGRFSFIMRVQKDNETDEFSQKRVTVKKKNQLSATPMSVTNFRMYVDQILSHLQRYNEDEDEDYRPGGEEEDEEDAPIFDFTFFRHHHNGNFNLVGDTDNDHVVQSHSYYHRYYPAATDRGSLENPINLLDNDDDNFLSSRDSPATGTVNSSSNAGSSQPVIIDLTDDQIQSDIRDISVDGASLVSIDEEEGAHTVNSRKRRRQFHASDELEEEFENQRSRVRGGHVSLDLATEEEFEL